MEYDEKEFCNRLGREIERLEERALVLEGNEKKIVQDMAHIMTDHLKRLERVIETSCEMDEERREQALSSIIDILNEIDAQLKNLDNTLNGQNRGFVTIHEATCIIDRFFVNCQIAEERIKDADQREYISQKQVDDLNEQLKRAVFRIIDISKQSDTLIKMLQEKYGADVTG